MRVLVFGAGAVGSVLAVMLSSGNEVDVAVRGDRAPMIAEGGITLHGKVRRTVWPKTAPHGRYDMIFITTKAYDVEEAADAVTAFADEGTTIVSLQNGLRHLDLLGKRFGECAIMAPTTLGAARTGPTTVKLATIGTTMVGSPTGENERAAAVAALLNAAGLKSEVSENIVSEVWMKAIVNACINPLAALAGVPNGRLLERTPLLSIAERACFEAARASEECGVVLPYSDAFARVKEVMRSTSENRCSMLQDLETGRRTEIDEINGELARKGEAAGVRMDVNRSLWVMVRAAEGRVLSSQCYGST